MLMLRRIVPWLIALSLLAYLFRRYSAQDVLEAMGQASLPALLPFLIAYFACFTLTDALSLWKTTRHLDISARFSRILKLRLVSNLPTMVNYGIGQGFLAYLMGKKLGITAGLAVSILLLLLGMDLYWAITISALGALFTEIVINGRNLGPWIHGAWLAASALLLLLLALRPWLLRSTVFAGLRGDISAACRQISVKDHVRLMLWRLPLHAAAASYLYFLAMCFDVHIPFLLVIALLPITVAIGALPLAPSGLGTVQFAAVFLFGQHVSGGAVDAGQASGPEMIFAMSLVFTLGLYVLKVTFGLLAWKGGAVG